MFSHLENKLTNMEGNDKRRRIQKNLLTSQQKKKKDTKKKKKVNSSWKSVFLLPGLAWPNGRHLPKFYKSVSWFFIKECWIVSSTWIDFSLLAWCALKKIFSTFLVAIFMHKFSQGSSILRNRIIGSFITATELLMSSSSFFSLLNWAEHILQSCLRNEPSMNKALFSLASFSSAHHSPYYIIILAAIIILNVTR